jgi:biopolymer transport protein ExbD
MAGGGAAPESGKKGKKSLDANINLVPFIDLLSCCISFLLITAVWTQISGLQVASSGGPPDGEKKPDQTIDVKLLLTDKGYSLTMVGAAIEIPKINSAGPVGSPDATGAGEVAAGALAYDFKALAEKLKTLKASLPDQQAITLQPDDGVAYGDLVSTVDTCIGQKLRNVTVAPLN